MRGMLTYEIIMVLADAIQLTACFGGNLLHSLSFIFKGPVLLSFSWVPAPLAPR